VTTTRSGRAVHLPERFQDDEVGLIAATQSNYEISLTAAEEKYYDTMRDLSKLGMNSEHCLVVAGLGGGFDNTAELHVMKYDEAMATDQAEEWHDAVEDEHNRMLEHDVFEPTPRENMPPGVMPITSTWAMKQKANGTLRARMNA